MKPVQLGHKEMLVLDWTDQDWFTTLFSKYALKTTRKEQGHRNSVYTYFDKLRSKLGLFGASMLEMDKITKLQNTKSTLTDIEKETVEREEIKSVMVCKVTHI